MKNKYIFRSRISQKKFREILKYFTQDIEASKIANLTGIFLNFHQQNSKKYQNFNG